MAMLTTEVDKYAIPTLPCLTSLNGSPRAVWRDDSKANYAVIWLGQPSLAINIPILGIEEARGSSPRSSTMFRFRYEVLLKSFGQ